MERAAVILCAGQGTRMRSDIAKVLHEIWGQPMALWPIKAAIQGGAEQVIAVVGHQAERVESTLKKYIPELAFALQADERDGARRTTGHAFTPKHQGTVFGGVATRLFDRQCFEAALRGAGRNKRAFGFGHGRCSRSHRLRKNRARHAGPHAPGVEQNATRRARNRRN